MADIITPLILRAIQKPIACIGQFSDAERRELDRAVKKGWLSKGKGGPFPIIKTVYAHPGFDFAADRQASIDEMMEISRFDQRMREARRG
jgi:hypothetical protein